MGSDPVVFRDVEKNYGGLRPLRIRELRILAGKITMLVGFDRPTAEVFVNLLTGASLPDQGEVVCFDQPTSAIVDSDAWLTFVEHFGIVSDRVVLLEAMTVAQNLAIAFDLDLEPVPPEVMARVTVLAAESGIDAALLDTRIAEAAPLLRARVYLARALAFDPKVLVLEHPSAHLSPQDVDAYAMAVRSAAERRRLTTIGLVMDEKFAKATRGRLLMWQPASGEFSARSSFRFW